MKLLTERQYAQLSANGEQEQTVRGTVDEIDFVPVVKLFTPDANATWLLTEVDPADTDIAFGLCDLGLGCPELRSVRLSELQTVRGPLGLPVERDLHFTAKQSLCDYAEVARMTSRIVT